MMDNVTAQHWSHIVNSPLFLITLTILAYQAGQLIYQQFAKPFFLHPLIISSIFIAAAITQLSINYQDYFDATDLLYFLLGPTTVALAVPLHQYFSRVKAQVIAITVSVIIGGLSAIFSALWLADMMGASHDVLLSLAPKSVTTPIALSIISVIGGSPFLTAGIVVATGVIGATIAPVIFHRLDIQDHRIQGFTLGLAAHGVGTAKAFEISREAGAFASLALGLTGILIALSLPHIMHWFI